MIAHGVTILGPLNLPSAHALHASQIYSRNLQNFLVHLAPEGKLVLDLADEITRGPLLTHDGEVMHEGVRARLAKELTMDTNALLQIYIFVLAGFVGYQIITQGARRCCTRR